MAWIDEVENALYGIGGTGTLSEIYSQIQETTNRELVPSWQAIVRRTLEEASSDSESYLGKKDIFYSVDGIGKGKWGLRDEKSLAELFIKISKGYGSYRKSKGTDSNHPTYKLVVREVPSVIQKMNFIEKRNYKIKGSTGVGNVTAAPWIAIMDKAVTDVPTREYYVVYLYSVDLDRIYLSLAFGVTKFSELHGEGKKILRALEKASNEMSRKLYINEKMIRGKLNLDREEKSKLHLKYEFSNIAAIEYKISDLPDDRILKQDLRDMLDLYTQAWRKIGTGFDEKMSEESVNIKEKKPEVIEFRERMKPNSRKKGEKNFTRKNYSKESRLVGNEGERIVFEEEKKKLNSLGRPDLSKKVRWVADEGEKPGWDIESFDKEGNIMRIEVKASKGRKNNIIITENEKLKAEEYGDSFFLAIVENVLHKSKCPTIEYIRNPMKKFGSMNNPSPLSWKMNLWNE